MKQLDRATPHARLSHQRASITVRRSGASHVPRTDADRALDVQDVGDVKIYQMSAIAERATAEWRAKLHSLRQQLHRPFGASARAEPVRVPVSAQCFTRDCAKLLHSGIVSLVSEDEERRRPSLGRCKAFSVVERNRGAGKPDRRRWILHPEEQNDAAYASGFVSCVDLHHVSAYLGDVYHEVGCVSDISASFYGLELPLASRAFYRFRDEHGTLYEMNRGMMGHTLMADIQHIITNIVAGHPAYVQPRFAAPCVTRVWIDNINFVGSRERVAVARDRLAATCSDAQCHVAMDVGSPAQQYAFIGVDFDHAARTTCLAAKTRRKLPATLPDAMPAEELEQLVSRLIFAAAVRQEPLANHWWALKWSRRFFNKINRGQLHPHALVPICGSARTSLAHWLETAATPHVVNRAFTGRRATLFTDATLNGWGAVLISDDGRIVVVGGRFEGGQRAGDIGRKEAWAVVNALRALRDPMRGVSDLDLFVDNTSVEAALRRGVPRADSLVEPVAAAWRDVIGSRISLFVDYVSTKVNPSDAASRGQRVALEAVQHAMRHTTNNNTTREMAVANKFVSAAGP